MSLVPQPTSNKIVKMPFGKWKDAELCDIPTEYLIWFESEVTHMGKYLRDAVNFEINRRSGNITSIGRDVK